MVRWVSGSTPGKLKPSLDAWPRSNRRKPTRMSLSVTPLSDAMSPGPLPPAAPPTGPVFAPPPGWPARAAWSPLTAPTVVTGAVGEDPSGSPPASAVAPGPPPNADARLRPLAFPDALEDAPESPVLG